MSLNLLLHSLSLSDSLNWFNLIGSKFAKKQLKTQVKRGKQLNKKREKITPFYIKYLSISPPLFTGPNRGGGSAIDVGSGFNIKSTCHLAMNNCENDGTCNRYLDQVKKMCDPLTCDRNKCMRAIKEFYRNIPERHSMDIAFCLCK